MTTMEPRDTAFEVPDPTDWQGTALQGFASVETPMRCQVCKEFMTTPMITSCGHTFCSVCIRRCLANDGLCPACRTPDQELKLRINKSMEEVIESFQRVRKPALEVARLPSITSVLGSPKRKCDASYGDDQDLKRRKTRSSMRITSQESQEGLAKDIDIELAAEDYGKYITLFSAIIKAHASNIPLTPDDSIVSCPICSARVKIERINGHLDTCVGGNSNTISGFTDRSPSVATNPKLQRPNYEPTPLPTLNYSLLSDTNLRKRLKDLGISFAGSRSVLERRHREWLTLWNANCDASKPRSKTELLRELDTWEKTQGSQGTSRNNNIGSGGLPIASKDFDSAAWSSKHGSAYRSLIEEAGRNKRQKPNREATPTSYPSGMASDEHGNGFDYESKKCAD